MPLFFWIKIVFMELRVIIKNQKWYWRKADEWRGYSGGYLRITAHLSDI